MRTYSSTTFTVPGIVRISSRVNTVQEAIQLVPNLQKQSRKIKIVHALVLCGYVTLWISIPQCALYIVYGCSPPYRIFIYGRP